MWSTAPDRSASRRSRPDRSTSATSPTTARRRPGTSARTAASASRSTGLHRPTNVSGRRTRRAPAPWPTTTSPSRRSRCARTAGARVPVPGVPASPGDDRSPVAPGAGDPVGADDPTGAGGPWGAGGPAGSSGPEDADGSPAVAPSPGAAGGRSAWCGRTNGRVPTGRTLKVARVRLTGSNPTAAIHWSSESMVMAISGPAAGYCSHQVPSTRRSTARTGSRPGHDNRRTPCPPASPSRRNAAPGSQDSKPVPKPRSRPRATSPPAATSSPTSVPSAEGVAGGDSGRVRIPRALVRASMRTGTPRHTALGPRSKKCGTTM